MEQSPLSGNMLSASTNTVSRFFLTGSADTVDRQQKVHFNYTHFPFPLHFPFEGGKPSLPPDFIAREVKG